MVGMELAQGQKLAEQHPCHGQLTSMPIRMRPGLESLRVELRSMRADISDVTYLGSLNRFLLDGAPSPLRLR